MACEKLIERLRPYLQKFGTWNDAVQNAYFDRVGLCELSHNNIKPAPTHNVAPDGRLVDSSPGVMQTFGAACSEVEIDCLTGFHKISSTIIVMDIGRSINPGIDMGQIEGAFMQGYGLYCMEDPEWDDQGRFLSIGPNSYKVPLSSNVPQHFSVYVLNNGRMPIETLYSSRPVGEPPILLGNSVFFAIKEAILAARKDAGISGPFRMDAPASPKKVVEFCAPLIQKFDENFLKNSQQNFSNKNDAKSKF